MIPEVELLSIFLSIYLCMYLSICFIYVSIYFCGTRTSHCCGLSRRGAQAPDVQAQQPWLTGPAARTGARTRVPCIGRWTLKHCATREAQEKDSII